MKIKERWVRSKGRGGVRGRAGVRSIWKERWKRVYRGKGTRKERKGKNELVRKTTRVKEGRGGRGVRGGAGDRPSWKGRSGEKKCSEK